MFGHALRKFFGRSAPDNTPSQPVGRVQFMSPSQALWEMMHYPKVHHHVQLFLTDVDPRHYGYYQNMHETELFLACSGDRLDVYVTPEAIAPYQHHRFLDMLKKTHGASLIVIPEAPFETDTMLSSYGMMYVGQEGAAGIFQDTNESLALRLQEAFGSLWAKYHPDRYLADERALTQG